MTEELATQIEHDQLARPLHVVGLEVLKGKSKDQQSNVNPSNLRNSGEGTKTEVVAEERMRSLGRGQILVNCDFYQVRARNIGTGFQNDGNQRYRYLPPVRTQVRQQPLH